MAHYLEKVLNKAKSKSPHEMVAKCHAALEKLGEGSSDKQQEELGKYLGLMKVCTTVSAESCLEAASAMATGS